MKPPGSSACRCKQKQLRQRSGLATPSNLEPKTRVFSLYRVAIASFDSRASYRTARFVGSDRGGSRLNRTRPRSRARVDRRGRSWRLEMPGTERQLKRRRSSVGKGEKALTAKRGRGI